MNFGSDETFEAEDGYYEEELEEVDFGDEDNDYLVGNKNIKNTPELTTDKPKKIEETKELNTSSDTEKIVEILDNKEVKDSDGNTLNKTLTNNSDMMSIMGMMDLTKIERVKIEDEEVEVKDTLNNQETGVQVELPTSIKPILPLNEGVSEQFTPETNIQPITPSDTHFKKLETKVVTTNPVMDVFATGLEIKREEVVETIPVDEAKDLNSSLDDMYKKAQEEEKQIKEESATKVDITDEIEPEYYIFGKILGDNKPERENYRKELLLEFTKNNIFEDEFYVFYMLLRDYGRIYPNKAFITTYLQNHQAILQNIPNINIGKFRQGDNDEYSDFVASCVDKFEVCSKLEIDDNDFYVNLEMKKMTHINVESIQTFAEATQIITEGLGHGKYTKKGYTDMRMHVNRKFVELDNLVHKTNRKGVIIYGKTVLEDDERDAGILFKFGIKALDEALGGLNRGMMLSLLAPPKGFKSRLSVFILHSALIQGINSLAWSLENGYKGLECLIRARHFYWYYLKNGHNQDGRLDIDAKEIMDCTLSPDKAELESASWHDLQNNPEYGTFLNMDLSFEYETFVDILEEQIKLHNVEFILLDYLQLVEGSNIGMMKNERIGSAYQRTLRLIKNNNISGLMPGQIKQSVINDLSRLNEDDLENYELRDAGAESSEVVRTPDINVMIYGTKTMIQEGKSYLLSVPSRYSKPFKPIKMAVKAQHCTFASVSPDAW